MATEIFQFTKHRNLWIKKHIDWINFLLLLIYLHFPITPESTFNKAPKSQRWSYKSLWNYFINNICKRRAMSHLRSSAAVGVGFFFIVIPWQISKHREIISHGQITKLCGGSSVKDAWFLQQLKLIRVWEQLERIQPNPSYACCL